MRLILLLLINIAHPIQFNAYPSTKLQLLFNLPQNGWLGADGDTTLQLYNDTYLWLFGDTFIGCYDTQTNQRCSNRSFVHSTIALQQKAMQPIFIWNESNNKPITFFVPSQQYKKQYAFDYWWIVKGISNGSTLLLTGPEIQQLNTTPPFNFAVKGNDMLRVDNIYDEPIKWNYTYQHVPYSNANITWSTDMTWSRNKSSDLIYWIGLIHTDNGRFNIISKGYFNDLAEFKFDEFTFYSRNIMNQSGWFYIHDIVTFNYVITTEPNRSQSALTVFFNEILNKWYTFVIPFGGNKVYLYLSNNQSIISKWSNQIIYDIPSPWNNGSLYHEYACTSHPELSNNQSNQLVFSYIVQAWNGTMDFAPNGSNLYLPQFIAVDFH